MTEKNMSVELDPCAECGMGCKPGEYHPYAACLMFKACHNSKTVRENLIAVRIPTETKGEDEVPRWMVACKVKEERARIVVAVYAAIDRGDFMRGDATKLMLDIQKYPIEAGTPSPERGAFTLPGGVANPDSSCYPSPTSEETVKEACIARIRQEAALDYKKHEWGIKEGLLRAADILEAQHSDKEPDSV